MNGRILFCFWKVLNFFCYFELRWLICFICCLIMFGFYLGWSKYMILYVWCKFSFLWFIVDWVIIILGKLFWWLKFNCIIFLLCVFVLLYIRCVKFFLIWVNLVEMCLDMIGYSFLVLFIFNLLLLFWLFLFLVVSIFIKFLKFWVILNDENLKFFLFINLNIVFVKLVKLVCFFDFFDFNEILNVLNKVKVFELKILVLIDLIFLISVFLVLFSLLVCILYCLVSLLFILLIFYLIFSW